MPVAVTLNAPDRTPAIPFWYRTIAALPLVSVNGPGAPGTPAVGVVIETPVAAIRTIFTVPRVIWSTRNASAWTVTRCPSAWISRLAFAENAPYGSPFVGIGFG